MVGIYLPNTQLEWCTLLKWAERSHLARIVYDFAYTETVYDARYFWDHNLSINYAKIVEKWKYCLDQMLQKSSRSDFGQPAWYGHLNTSASSHFGSWMPIIFNRLELLELLSPSMSFVTTSSCGSTSPGFMGNHFPCHSSRSLLF